ncbi:DUF1642 domain-containing protein [Lacticaseibacillus paracasei]|uniref:DUF1642 domain-containing protein n=1 Tax=Lacticaseibacillus paracasei TaxID=1597 RepID=UPI0021E80FF0|nr:DUF1642 domain-containing protein [Lacticaseibacillus paracasei]UYI59420.1 DUF1642 domain-containing protein [Lacticaseibacillus paracasei]
MSEEKLYVVEDDNRLHLAFNDAGNPMWFQTGGNFTATDSVASMWSLKHGGHAVTFVEEPEKVVLSDKQAEIVEDAHNAKRPASYIILKSNDEELLMNAFVNGYTVAKEKKYNVKVPHAEGWHFHKYSSASKSGDANGRKPFPANDNDTNLNKSLMLFTKAEIEHYGLQDCEKEEVTDDDD